MSRALVLLLALSCVSCVALGTKVEEMQLRQFTRGQTSYYDVVAALGKPNVSILHADGSRMTQYTYTQSQLKAQNFVPFLAMFTQGATSETNTVTLDFDAREVLVNFTATTGQTVVGTGFLTGGKQ